MAAILVSSAIVIVILVIGGAFLVPLAWCLVIALASFQMLSRIEK